MGSLTSLTLEGHVGFGQGELIAKGKACVLKPSVGFKFHSQLNLPRKGKNKIKIKVEPGKVKEGKKVEEKEKSTEEEGEAKEMREEEVKER